MARHHRDLYLCRNLPGDTQALVCEKCEGRCPICDSHANPEGIVRICDECAFRQSDTIGRCILCQNPRGRSPAYYCHECVLLERDRDGCPRVKNVSTQKRDIHHTKAKFAPGAGT
jgi:hypothetical protein